MKKQNTIVFLNILSTLIIQGINFIASPIFSRLLGTNNYGVVTVYNTWVSIFSTVLTLQAASTLGVARSNFPEDEQAGYQSSVLFLATTIYVSFSFVILLVVGLFVKTVDFRILCLALAQGLAVYIISTVNSKFTFEFKAERNFILALLISILNMVLSLFLVKQFPASTNYMGRILGQVIANTLIAAILYVYLMHRGKTYINTTYWKFSLPIAIPTVFHLLANLVLNQSDKLMLQGMVDSSTVGIYGLAATLANVLMIIYGALNNSWVPFYYEYSRNNQINDIKVHSKNYAELFTVITCGFVLLCPEVFHLYASPEYWGGTVLLPIFAVGEFFVFLYSFPVNYEFYNKKTNIIAVGTTLAALCNIVLNYILIRHLGILGAVIATAIAHLLQFAFHFYRAKTLIEGKFPYTIKMFLPNIAIVISVAVITIAIPGIGVFRWILGFVMGVYMLMKMYKRRAFF